MNSPAMISPRDRWMTNAAGRIVGIEDPTGQRNLIPLAADLTPVLGGKIIYVDGRTAAQGGKGSASSDGSDWDSAMSTMTRAVAAATTGDLILFKGDIEEQGIATPAGVNYVTVVGMQSHQRNARWLSNGNAASPFIQVRGLGWIFLNIYFAGGTADYCISFLRDGTHNASEGRVISCQFNGGSGAIENDGGCSNMRYIDNDFVNVRGGTATTPGAIILTSAAQALPSNCHFEINRFFNCQRLIAHGCQRSRAVRNELQAIGHDGTATEVLNLNFVQASRDSAGGAYNWAFKNYLGNTNANITKSNGYIGGANSQWPNNYATDQVNTTLPI